MFQSLPGVQKPVGLQETFRSLFKLEKIHIGTAHIVVDPSVELLSQAFFVLFFQRIFVNPQSIYIHFILYQIVSFFLLSLDCREMEASGELEEEVRNSLKEAGEQAPPPQGEPQELLGQFIRDYHRSTGF